MNTGCPICGSDRRELYYERVFNYPDARIVRCKTCEHLYTVLTLPVNTDELYSDAVYQVVENRGSVFDRILDREYEGVIARIDAILPQKGMLLDFGCGKGKFGWLAARDGWQVSCVETAADRADYARSVYHLEVNTDFYENGSIFGHRFDVITLFHVLEHLPHPAGLTATLTSDNLLENGLFVVEVPDISSWQSSLAREKWIHLDVPRHINHFTRRRLSKMMTDLGFVPVKTTSFSFHLGVLGMLDALLKLAGYKKNIIFELKNRKRAGLLISIALVLPLALLLEALAAALGRGGVTRMYLKYR